MSDADFMGHYSPRLDEKGRLALPARFREDLGERIVVTKGLDRCLTVYPHETFKTQVLDRLAAGPTSSRAVRNLRRALLAHASTEAPDRQGRITIPAVLRDYAGLDKDVVVIGQGDYLELWDSATFAEIEISSDDSLDALDVDGGVLL